ncbi:MAG TPA: DUF481 domain-containing protein, partial [Methylophilus sp.]|nr:DUF481 domain-containing protein [Methylophilus sp.]
MPNSLATLAYLYVDKTVKCALFPLTMLSMLATPVLADTIWLKNGDKITGTLGVKISNKLTVKTTYADEVKINWNDIHSIDADKPILMQLSDGSIVNGRLIHTDEGQVILDEETNTPLVDT